MFKGRSWFEQFVPFLVSFFTYLVLMRERFIFIVHFLVKSVYPFDDGVPRLNLTFIPSFNDRVWPAHPAIFYRKPHGALAVTVHNLLLVLNILTLDDHL